MKTDDPMFWGDGVINPIMFFVLVAFYPFMRIHNLLRALFSGRTEYEVDRDYYGADVQKKYLKELEGGK